MDDALWQGAPARELTWAGLPGDDAAPAKQPSRPFPWLASFLAALSSFLFVAFIGMFLTSSVWFFTSRPAGLPLF